MSATNQIIQKVIGEEISKKLPAIKKLMEITIDERVPAILDDKLKYLPTKDEFYTKMDEVVGEIKAMREEFYASTAKVDRFETRVDDLEIEVFGQVAVA